MQNERLCGLGELHLKFLIQNFKNPELVYFFFPPHLLLPVKDKLIKENMVYHFMNQLKRLFFRKVILWKEVYLNHVGFDLFFSFY